MQKGISHLPGQADILYKPSWMLRLLVLSVAEPKIRN